jgi:hypothetical protein
MTQTPDVTNTEEDYPTKADMELWDESADHLFNAMFERAQEAEQDPVGIAFSLWMQLTHMLAQSGWEPEELATEALRYGHVCTTEGSA